MRKAKNAVAALTAFAISAFTAAFPARADTPVDLELVLAVDVSGSMDTAEAELQRNGYLNALVDPRVVRVIQAGFRGAVAVSYIEWAAFGHNVIVADWAAIRDNETAQAFAAGIADKPVSRGMYTSISGIIEYALPTFDGNGFDGLRRVIDISGDGANNAGNLVPAARDLAVAAGITVNGLPIVNDRINPFGRPQIPNLDLYYRECVIGGRGAFIVVAQGFDAFAEAIRRKLIFEIAGRAPVGGVRVVSAPHPPAAPALFREAGLRLAGSRPGDPVLAAFLRAADRQAPPCDIGERMREQRRMMWDDQ